MADDSDGEGFYDDPFEDASDGDDSCGEEEYDEGCVGPSDEEEDDDSNGEGMCEVPCCSDEDCEADDSEDLCDDDDDDGESEEALPDVDDDGGESEELCDEEGNGEELVDDPCDEDDEEGDGDAEDLSEDRPSNDGEEGEREVSSSVSGSTLDDGTDMSDSVQDDSSYSEVEDERRTRAPWSMPHMQFMNQTYTDSDDGTDYDSDGTDYDVGEYERRRLPASRAVVESLPEASLSEEEAACGCAVCKDVFELGQHVVRLPCKHYFHGDCIRPWLAISNTCPVCRYQLPTDDVESPQGEAQQLGVLTSVARQGETQQSGGRDGGDGRGATTGAGDARD